jgi:hypothetical protein
MKNKEIKLYLISKEERDFIDSNYGLISHILDVNFNLSVSKEPSKTEFKWDNKIVWFGGLSSHKEISVDYFIDEIFNNIRNDNPKIHFYLFGSGTLKYTNIERGITGYGFVKEFLFEKFSNSIFINPDIIGGGVKLKLKKLYYENVFCLSTVLGTEGFSYKDTYKNLHIVSISEWEIFFKNFNK